MKQGTLYTIYSLTLEVLQKSEYGQKVGRAKRTRFDMFRGINAIGKKKTTFQSP